MTKLYNLFIHVHNVLYLKVFSQFQKETNGKKKTFFFNFTSTWFDALNISTHTDQTLYRTRPFTEFWVVSIEHLRRVWHADRQGTLTHPDTWSRPFGTCICSACWDQSFSELVVILPDFALRISLGTFSISHNWRHGAKSLWLQRILKISFQEKRATSLSGFPTGFNSSSHYSMFYLNMTFVHVHVSVSLYLKVILHCVIDTLVIFT